VKEKDAKALQRHTHGEEILEDEAGVGITGVNESAEEPSKAQQADERYCCPGFPGVLLVVFGLATETRSLAVLSQRAVKRTEHNDEENRVDEHGESQRSEKGPDKHAR
jgi:hypothetical protein